MSLLRCHWRCVDSVDAGRKNGILYRMMMRKLIDGLSECEVKEDEDDDEDEYEEKDNREEKKEDALSIICISILRT